MPGDRDTGDDGRPARAGHGGRARVDLHGGAEALGGQGVQVRGGQPVQGVEAYAVDADDEDAVGRGGHEGPFLRRVFTTKAVGSGRADQFVGGDLVGEGQALGVAGDLVDGPVGHPAEFVAEGAGDVRGEQHVGQRVQR